MASRAANEFEGSLKFLPGAPGQPNELLNITMEGRNLDDDGVFQWTVWARSQVPASAHQCGILSGQIIWADKVDFSKNQFGDVGLRCLLRFFHNHKINMKVLKLSKNHLGRGAAFALADFLGGCQSLCELYLSNNYIPREGAVEILNAVAQNRAFPVKRPGVPTRHQALFIRLDNNVIKDPDTVVEEAELLQTELPPHLRRPAPDAALFLVVHDASKGDKGCTLDHCEYGGLNSCHLAHIHGISAQREARVPKEALQWEETKGSGEALEKQWRMNPSQKPTLQRETSSSSSLRGRTPVAADGGLDPLGFQIPLAGLKPGTGPPSIPLPSKPPVADDWEKDFAESNWSPPEAQWSHPEASNSGEDLPEGAPPPPTELPILDGPQRPFPHPPLPQADVHGGGSRQRPAVPPPSSPPPEAVASMFGKAPAAKAVQPNFKAPPEGLGFPALSQQSDEGVAQGLMLRAILEPPVKPARAKPPPDTPVEVKSPPSGLPTSGVMAGIGKAILVKSQQSPPAPLPGLPGPSTAKPSMAEATVHNAPSVKPALESFASPPAQMKAPPPKSAPEMVLPSPLSPPANFALLARASTRGSEAEEESRVPPAVPAPAATPQLKVTAVLQRGTSVPKTAPPVTSPPPQSPPQAPVEALPRTLRNAAPPPVPVPPPPDLGLPPPEPRLRDVGVPPSTLPPAPPTSFILANEPTAPPPSIPIQEPVQDVEVTRQRSLPDQPPGLAQSMSPNLPPPPETGPPPPPLSLSEAAAPVPSPTTFPERVLPPDPLGPPPRPPDEVAAPPSILLRNLGEPPSVPPPQTPVQQVQEPEDYFQEPVSNMLDDAMGLGYDEEEAGGAWTGALGPSGPGSDGFEAVSDPAATPGRSSWSAHAEVPPGYYHLPNPRPTVELALQCHPSHLKEVSRIADEVLRAFYWKLESAEEELKRIAGESSPIVSELMGRRVQWLTKLHHELGPTYLNGGGGETQWGEPY